jgi:hypothetical protein
MTAATFDHQVGKALEFFEQQRNEKTACARFIGALYFEARAESRMRLDTLLRLRAHRESWLRQIPNHKTQVNLKRQSQKPKTARRSIHLGLQLFGYFLGFGA